jgi:pyruvate kinase
MIKRLIEAGVSVFRVNFSHGKLEEHEETIRDIREIAGEMQRTIAILGDLSGPKIRCGMIKDGPIFLDRGHQIELLMDPDYEGTHERIGVGYTQMIYEVEETHRISMNDGNVVLRVVSKDTSAFDGKGSMMCTVEEPGEINSRKGINCPDSSLSANPVTDYDIKCIEFGCKLSVDYFALSFVRSAEDIRQAKLHVKKYKSDIPIIAKVERHEAIEAIDEIIREADGAMVARGDLGVEIPLQDVPNAQKRMIRLCNKLGKPVITATQMLESMTDSHRPTRAEVSDVANAIYDGTDAVMLSGETATGKYPIEAVRIMNEIALAAEKELIHEVDVEVQAMKMMGNISDALSRGACLIGDRLDCRAIISKTRFGSTPKLVARLRPKTRNITFTPSRTTARRLNLIWGVEPYWDPTARDNPDGVPQGEGPLIHELRMALQRGLVAPGDRVVLVSGLSIDNPDVANMMRVLEI